MSKRFEGSFEGTQEIFFQCWLTDQPRGTIVITHGLAEHSECYNSLAKLLNQERWNVVGWDMPGHGRSEGKRGFIRKFDEYQKNLVLLLTHLRSRSDIELTDNVVLFGHSMGGLITALTVLEEGDLGIRAVVLASPVMQLKMAVPKIKERIAKFAVNWFPQVTLFNEIHYRDLSRDEQQLASYPQDTLRHDKISPSVYLGMLDGFEKLAIYNDRWTLPLLMQLAGSDPIVDVNVARKFFDGILTENKTLQIYPESLHEIYNDLDRDQAFEDLKKFLNRGL